MPVEGGTPAPLRETIAVGALLVTVSVPVKLAAEAGVKETVPLVDWSGLSEVTRSGEAEKPVPDTAALIPVTAAVPELVSVKGRV